VNNIKYSHSVFEFGFVSADSRAIGSSRIEHISEQAFGYLKQLCLCDESESRFLRLRNVESCEVLQLNNYVGVLFTPDGTQIEVLPKVAKNVSGKNGKQLARDSLLMMLTALSQFRHLQTHNAHLSKSKMPLLEVFISQFLEAVNKLVKRGLRSDYQSREGNLAFLKGKLLVGQQLRINSINKHKFYVEYDEFLLDRPANRLIHSALNKVLAYTRFVENQRLLRELQFAFADIPTSSNIKGDFANIKNDRGMNYYQPALGWARLILEGFTPLTMQGANHAFSLLFPMEAVFESYVASVLRRQVSAGFELNTQSKSESLVTHNHNRYFRLMPDLLIKTQDGNQLVLDTKWKMIDSAKYNGTDKYGLSQADFYQMFAYGHKYLKGDGQLVLIYPKHEGFDVPIEHSFDFNHNGVADLTLWVVPFNIAHGVDDKNRLHLPEGCLVQHMFEAHNLF
jgi:5-methylcytosine-specific restriction enzyme subunit McrC